MHTLTNQNKTTVLQQFENKSNMKHYYREFTATLKKISLREQATEQSILDPRMNEPDREQLVSAYKQYSRIYYGIRVLPLLATGVFVATGLASRRSPYMFREVMLVVGLTSGIFYLDSLNSQHFWDSSAQIVKDITNYSDLMVIDDKRLQQMRSNYAQGAQMVQATPISPAKKNDKMDDD